VNLLADLARFARKGRRVVRSVERAVSAADRGAADLRAAAEGLRDVADVVQTALPHARRVLGSVEGALVRAGAAAPRDDERIGVREAPRARTAPRAASPAAPAAPPPPFDPHAPVVEAEIVEGPARPRSRR